MGKHSDIEWTHHTFNPWWGCTKVSPACEHCYAEAWAKRVGSKVWGKLAPRRFFSDSHWQEPQNWNLEARAKNVRYRVFCASMADVFEKRTELDTHRVRLWNLIEKTPNLDWLLLTKRPENISAMTPWNGDWPLNVWLGTTAENQKWLDFRIGHLLSHNSAVRFLSCEPLLSSIDLSAWVKRSGHYPIDWVIAGGESGPKSRPMQPDWIRKLRDFCYANGIAFHFKQWGHWIPDYMLATDKRTVANASTTVGINVKMIPVGKREAGRIFDGKTYDEFPKVA